MVVSIISGSQNANSVSYRVVKHLRDRFKLEFPDDEILLLDVRDHLIPLDNKVYKGDGQEPAHLSGLVQDFLRSDAFIFVSPEYNGTYTPALKNLLNHFPKFAHKPCGIVTASDGALGGMRAAQQLILLTPAHFGILSPYLLIVPQMNKKFDEDGKLLDDSFQKAVDTFVLEFNWLLEKIVK